MSMFCGNMERCATLPTRPASRVDVCTGLNNTLSATFIICIIGIGIIGIGIIGIGIMR